MPGGSRRLDIVYHIDTGQADAAAEAFNQRQATRDKKALTDAEAAEKAKQKLVERGNQAKIAAEMKRMAAEEEANRKSRSFMEWFFGKTKENTAATNEGAGAVAKFGVAMAGLQAAVPIMTTLSDHFAKMRQDASRAAEDVMRMRGAVRELQALRGEMGVTGQGIGHVFNIAKQTLQTPDQVKEMEAAGLGVGELAIKDNRDRDEFTKAMVAAGKFQQLEGGDAGAYGQMMGQIALQSKGPINAEDMEAQAFRLFQIQQPGGFKSMSQAMGQYSKVNGLVQNGIYTPEQAMAGLSAFSVSSPEEAATRLEQFTRAVMAGRIKSRGMQVSGDVDLMKTDEYFKSLGIGENDDAIARGKKISDDMARQQAAAQANGQQFNAYEYLMTKGFANAEDREAIMAMSGLRNTGRLEKIEEAMNAAPEKGAISRRFDERLKKDNFLKGRQVELAEQAANTQQGLQEEPLILAQRAAFARLKQQGKISGTFEEWQSTGFMQRGTQDLFFGGYHNQVNLEAQRALQAERERLGLPQYGTFQWSEHDTMRRSAQEVQSAGGDVTRGVADSLNKAAENIRRATEEMKNQAAAQPNRAPAPMPGRPAPQAARP